MSLKPPKESDLDKSWMKARLDRPKKIQPEYHLGIPFDCIGRNRHGTRVF
jgi:hypothetical protein